LRALILRLLEKIISLAGFISGRFFALL